MFEISVSSINISPFIRKAMMKEEVVPWNSIVRNATMASSLLPGMNLNDE